MGRIRFKRLAGLGFFAESVLQETEQKSGKFIPAEVIDAQFAAGDSGYNACYRATNGSMYYALSTHQPLNNARLYCFNPTDKKVELIANLGDVIEDEERDSQVAGLGQGKIHTPIFELEGMMYTASCQAILPGSWPYSGGRFLNIDLANHKVNVVGKAPDAQGIISMTIDREHKLLYGLTYPNGFLLVCNLETGITRNAGNFFGKGEQGYFRAPGSSPICRSLALDPRNGILYWSDSLGRIHAYEGDSGSSYWLPGFPLARDRVQKSRIWRQIFWHPDEQVFYGMIYKSNDLFRFDSEKESVDFIGHLSAGHSCNTRAQYEPPATLAFCLSPDNETIYYLATGPSIRTRSNHRTHRTVHFVSFHLTTRQQYNFGILRLPDGRYPVFCQSMAIEQGMIYAVCWIETLPEQLRENGHAIQQARKLGAPIESEGYIEEANLVRFTIPLSTWH